MKANVEGRGEKTEHTRQKSQIAVQSAVEPKSSSVILKKDKGTTTTAIGSTRNLSERKSGGCGEVKEK
jgi:hypothetical protein